MGIDEPKDRAVQLLKWLLDERDHERFLADKLIFSPRRPS
jgi:hypothetical protein